MVESNIKLRQQSWGSSDKLNYCRLASTCFRISSVTNILGQATLNQLRNYMANVLMFLSSIRIFSCNSTISFPRYLRKNLALAFFMLAVTFAPAVVAQSVTSSEMISPTPGTNLGSSSVTFSWTDVGALNYILRAGTTAGGVDIFTSSTGTSTSAIVPDLPLDQMVFVDLLTQQEPGGITYWVKSYVYNLDLDNDGIDDSIDPNPEVTDEKIQISGDDYVLTILGSGRVASLRVSPTVYDDLAVGITTPHLKNLTNIILTNLGDNFDFVMFANDQETASTPIMVHTKL